MSLNLYIDKGTEEENILYEDLEIEAIQIYGNDFYYLPKNYISKDIIIGEDRIPSFEYSYKIEGFFENVDGFEGQGSYLQHGLILEQSAQIVIVRRRWEQLVGRHGQTVLSNRPAEGDLLYFPLAKSLLEIKFVDYQNPFYQLERLRIYRLNVELFQYSSEDIDTGIDEIDKVEELYTLSTDTNDSPRGRVTSITITNGGSGYTSTPTVSISSKKGKDVDLVAVIDDGAITSVVVADGGSGYVDGDTVSITGGGGSGAKATATIEFKVDGTGGIGRNESYQDEADDLIVKGNNPLGDLT